MGVSSCGLLVKTELTEKELETVFDKKLIKKNTESYEDYLYRAINGDYIAVVKGSQGTVIFHDMYLLGQYSSSFIDKLKKLGGCGFAMSATSMAADFIHYQVDGIHQDSYLYEEEFTREGPNILGITENMEMLFEQVDELIEEYIGGYETWSDAVLFELGDSIPKEIDKDFKKAADDFGLREKSSGALLELAVSGIALNVNSNKDLGKFGEMMNIHFGLSLKLLEGRGAKLNSLYPDNSPVFNEIEKAFKNLSLSELRAIQIEEQQSILAGKSHRNSVSRYSIAKKVIEERVSYLRKQKIFKEKAKEVAQTLDDKSIEELTFMYLFSCSSIEIEKLSSTQTILIKKALEIQFEKRKFKFQKSANEKETYQYFDAFFNLLTVIDLQFQDYNFSTLGKINELVIAYESYPLLKAMKAQFISRELKPAKNTIMHHLLNKDFSNRDIPSHKEEHFPTVVWKIAAGVIFFVLFICLLIVALS